MLLTGVNHLALLTHDSDRLVAFYREVFDAEIGARLAEFDGAIQLTFIRIGPTAELNVFQIEGNTEADRQAPMFERGRIDHLGLQAASLDAFDQIRDRLIARAPAITSSPISAPSSASSSETRTAWRVRCALRTPPPCPECTTRPAPPPPGTPLINSRTAGARSVAHWRVLKSAQKWPIWVRTYPRSPQV